MEPQKTVQHDWLQQLVGDWVSESECVMGPDQPPMKIKGKESVRSLGGLWTIGEGSSDTPGNQAMASIMTLGYDPRIGKFVGSFVANCMTHFWPYLGTLDSSEKILTLDSEGPSFSGDGSLQKYQDIIEFIDANHRTLTARVQNADGSWNQFMKSHYHRV